MAEPLLSQLDKLRLSIETQRGVLGDEVVNTALAALQLQMSALEQQDAAQGSVDIDFGHQAALDGLLQLVIGDAAADITASLESHGGGFHGISSHLVGSMNVGQHLAVRNHVALELPFTAQRVHQPW
jgi:hypothetical protein